jgi:hypothetical protein
MVVAEARVFLAGGGGARYYLRGGIPWERWGFLKKKMSFDYWF